MHLVLSLLLALSCGTTPFTIKKKGGGEISCGSVGLSLETPDWLEGDDPGGAGPREVLVS